LTDQCNCHSSRGNSMLAINMDIVCAKLLKNEFLTLVSQLAIRKGVKAYFVGGGLRDVLMGREMKDFDFVLSGVPEVLPLSFAEEIQGTFFWLDRQRFQSRVVRRHNGDYLFFDFAALRGCDITHDLLLRDFTINALALPLSADQRSIIDPCHGLDDLIQGAIRVCYSDSFDDDPLRLLRAHRFATVLGFSIEPGTWKKIEEKASLLRQVAPERIRGEFFQILETPDAGTALESLYESGLLSEIIPFISISVENRRARQAQRMNRVREIESVMREPLLFFPSAGEQIEQIFKYLSCEVEAGVSVGSLVKLVVLLRENENYPAMFSMAPGNLRLGSKAVRFLKVLCSEAGPVLTEPGWKPTERAMYRFFKDHEPAGLAVIIIALARKLLSPKLCSRMAKYYFDEYPHEREETLLSGKEIMNLLGIGPGKKVGEAMDHLRKAERSGLVNSKKEARDFLGKNLLTKDEPVI
jgi:poly(A) polymerase